MVRAVAAMPHDPTRPDRRSHSRPESLYRAAHCVVGLRAGRRSRAVRLCPAPEWTSASSWRRPFARKTRG